MKTAESLSLPRIRATAVLFDLSAVLLVYLVPTFSHLLNFPLYLAEPMRLMVILALLHTTPRNAYFLAFTLPLFSFLTSGHPHLLKMLLIIGELLLNVWIFNALIRTWRSTFTSMLAAIVISKAVYYLAKFILIQLLLIESGLISTPLYIQAIMLVLFSSYAFLIFRRRKAESSGTGAGS
jgi:hypothetical protein